MAKCRSSGCFLQYEPASADARDFHVKLHFYSRQVNVKLHGAMDPFRSRRVRAVKRESGTTLRATALDEQSSVFLIR
jgi:hypothetical protein